MCRSLDLCNDSGPSSGADNFIRSVLGSPNDSPLAGARSVKFATIELLCNILICIFIRVGICIVQHSQ
jgi:hypothetical protein